MEKYKEFLKTLKKESPIECEFSIGETVMFTNEYGVSFSGMKIIGFADNDAFYGRFIHLDKNSYWFPVRPDELTLESKVVTS